MSLSNQKLLRIFETLGINNFSVTHHEPITTMAEGKKITDMLEGDIAVNLFLKDKQKQYYLLIKNVITDIKINAIAKKLEIKGLTNASEGELIQILSVERGAVSPLALVNDTENKVIVLLDKNLGQNKINVHPLVNTETVTIEFSDLEKIFNYCGKNKDDKIRKF
jgi:Ala-tRNA(Pro) deacylase